MKFIVLFFVLASIASAKTRWVSHDFFVETDNFSEDGKGGVPSDCRAHIKKSVCLVDPSINGDWSCSDRPCVAGGEAYVTHFERLYDAYPKALQKMFCHMDNIFIEPNFAGTAYAGTKVDPTGKTKRVCIGIRKSVIDDKLNLEQWASWKEQLSFGGETENYKLTPGLPLIESYNKKPVNDFLYFVIAHEFGHQFDFANKLNVFKDANCKLNEEGEGECAMAAGSFGSLSWLTNKEVKPEFEFPHRKELCFYWCEGNKILPSEQTALYHRLYSYTPFISTYATTQPWDDFADSLAYTVTRQQLGAYYALYAGNYKYDMMGKLGCGIFKNKYNYISRFLARKDIKYPKD